MSADAYFANVLEHEYHRDRGRLSGSVLDKVARDPREFRDWWQGKPEAFPNDDMRLGTYVHALTLLGSEEARRTTLVAPNRHRAYLAMTKAEKNAAASGSEVKRRKQDPRPEGEFLTMMKTGAENQALWDAFEQRARGRYIKPEEIPVATAMAAAVARHEKAGALLAPGCFEPEKAGYWTCQYTGQPMRMMLDAACEPDPKSGLDQIGELKCAHLIDPTNDVMAWLRCGWGRKAAAYIDGYIAITGRYPIMWWIFVEPTKDEPRVVTRWVDSESPFVIAGRHGFRDIPGYIELIKRARTMIDTDTFCHPWELQNEAQVALPEWALNSMESEARHQ